MTPQLKVIAGNWKMHHGPEETRAFFRRFDLAGEGEAPARGSGGSTAGAGAGTPATAQADGAPGEEEGVRLLVFPPHVSLAAALDARPDSPIVSIGAQNVHWEAQGAFTGETSAPMVARMGASHVLVGHSERRHLFGETDEETARKVEAALAAGLTPMLCVGETLEERRAGRVEEVVLRQLDAVLDVLAAGTARAGEAGGSRPAGERAAGDGAGQAGPGGSTSDFLLAYEPVWAIGTGETATPEDAAHAHGTLRARLREALGDVRGRATPVLYGGSVKPENAGELLATADVDGVLVGGASLDPGSFAAIAREGIAAARTRA